MKTVQSDCRTRTMNFNQSRLNQSRVDGKGNFHIKTSRTNQQLFSFSRTGANIWNGIPLKVRELEKASFMRKLKRMLLQILQTGEMNVDMRYLNLSKYTVS